MGRQQQERTIRRITQRVTKEEHEKLLRAKGNRTWPQFVLQQQEEVSERRMAPVHPPRHFTRRKATKDLSPNMAYVNKVLGTDWRMVFISIEQSDFKKVLEKKGNMTWREYLLSLADEELPRKKKGIGKKR